MKNQSVQPAGIAAFNFFKPSLSRQSVNVSIECGAYGLCLTELTDYVTVNFVEKRLPHYRVQEILAVVSARGLGVFTATAAFNAAAMGLSEAQAIAVVMSITRAMFYKSMTTNNDSRKWQACITSLARIAKLPTSNSRCKMVWW